MYLEKVNEYPYKLSIIIPIYNKGKYLERCLKSIEACDRFSEFEIILVDDGSDSIETIQEIKKIEKQYSNIVTYFFPCGGSGSASRPRNKGVLLSRAKYVAYLDPDDEMINKGFDRLYNAIENTEYDVVIGNMEVLYGGAPAPKKVDYYQVVMTVNGNSPICSDGKALILQTRFMSVGITAKIIRKQYLLENRLQMIEGAVGEDTIFHYELLLNSKQVKVIPDIIYRYYPQNADSVLNNISIQYFKSRLIAEKEKVNVYKKYGIYDQYMEKKEEEHFKSFIYYKLKYLPEEKQAEAKEILKEIYQLHAEKWDVKSVALRKYLEI